MGDPTHDTVSPWIPEQDPQKAKPLGKLMEELAECTAAAARCMIQGIDESEPETGKVNRQWLEEEMADVVAVMRYATETLGVGPDPVRIQRKLANFRRWHQMEGQQP